MTMHTKEAISIEQSEILNDLLEEAAESPHIPPAPPGGIPRQRLPPFIRKVLRWSLLPFVLLASIGLLRLAWLDLLALA